MAVVAAFCGSGRLALASALALMASRGKGLALAANRIEVTGRAIGVIGGERQWSANKCQRLAAAKVDDMGLVRCAEG